MTRAKGKSQRQNGDSKGKAKPTIPMAYVKGKSKKRSKRSRNSRGENEIVVSGRDLVVPTPKSLPVGDQGQFSVFQLVPANPTYWEGTRIQKLAQTYQLYRPLKFKVHYHPQVPVTNPGLVVYGTLYQDQATTDSALQQVLNTSNGGGIKECYSPFTSVVDVGDKFLQMRTYNTVGSASDTSNCPFIWCATYSGYSSSAVSTSSCPGWVEVEWTYRFVNGLPGPGNQSRGMFIAQQPAIDAYNRMMPRAVPRIDWNAPFGIPIGILKTAAEPLLRHISCVLLKETRVGPVILGIGKALNWMISQVGARAATTVVTDDAGREIEIPDDTPVVVLQSGMPQAYDPEVVTMRSIDVLSVKLKGVVQTSGGPINIDSTAIGENPGKNGIANIGNFTLYWSTEDSATTFTLRYSGASITSGNVSMLVSANDIPIASAECSQYVSPNLIGPTVYFQDCLFKFN